MSISVVPEATHKACQGSETETRELLGGMKENSSDFPMTVPEGQINDFLQVGNRKKLELVARP